ncbi:uncharacterized protein [Blastocystis hominis]|uniref:SET domain-containing protein n=1 Tax=Blastocystis hominis TaxID=12968 RepID=D8LV60_BLAHO|nr:uncharacterized protein [Blastocystis hominis]CBK19699.2 unnamed protein product [Blastocystis hominis]|eukprot:XP_012893747.1 uncharacterized protein [Blastocystis hominis]
MEYVGEVLRRAVAEDRIRTRCESRNYMLEVRENYANMVLHTYIDATHFGNESRFVNHSCDPNCAVHIIRTSTLFPHVVLVALRDIQEGEEICFHYGGSNAVSSCKCHCNAPNCQGYVPFSLSIV